MILRPFGLICAGHLELGLELQIEFGVITKIGPQTGYPEPIVISPPFHNAHSHLEYLSFQDQIHEDSYWPWIRRLTELKSTQTPEEIVENAQRGSALNRSTGVSALLEHADRPGIVEELSKSALSGTIFHELITFFERDNPAEKVRHVRAKVNSNRSRNFSSGFALHSPYTVDEDTLKSFATETAPISIHVAETVAETEHFRSGKGDISEFYARNGFNWQAREMTSVEFLNSLGLCRPGVQYVHCCDVSDHDIELMRVGGVEIAHCPRSNQALKCPIAPIRRMISAGIPVAIGLDSAASSGPINMFAEMRSALQSSRSKGEPLTPEQVWSLASAGQTLVQGQQAEFLIIHAQPTDELEHVMNTATPGDVQWQMSE